jgi:hypothetical protein
MNTGAIDFDTTIQILVGRTTYASHTIAMSTALVDSTLLPHKPFFALSTMKHVLSILLLLNSSAVVAASSWGSSASSPEVLGRGSDFNVGMGARMSSPMCGPHLGETSLYHHEDKKQHYNVGDTQEVMVTTASSSATAKLPQSLLVVPPQFHQEFQGKPRDPLLPGFFWPYPQLSRRRL